VASETLVAPFNDVGRVRELVRRQGNELAAVLVEPMMGRGAIPAENEFLAMLREETRACGAMLVFDEIQTFRLAYGAAQQISGVTPDLTTLGKVIGGGFPIGAFGGRREVLERYAPDRPGHLSHSGTFNGNTMAMVAGLATLELLTREEIDRINALGARLRVELQALLDDAGIDGAVTGVGSYAWVHFAAPPIHDARDAARFDGDLARRMHLALLVRGIFSAGGTRFVVSTPMRDAEIDLVVRAFASSLGVE
jgi:glutamate-1-semialdehyde 2,1-aminomutase